MGCSGLCGDDAGLEETHVLDSDDVPATARDYVAAR